MERGQVGEAARNRGREGWGREGSSGKEREEGSAGWREGVREGESERE